MNKTEIVTAIHKAVEGLNTLLINEKINARKISSICKLRRDLVNLKSEIENGKLNVAKGEQTESDSANN